MQPSRQVDQLIVSGPEPRERWQVSDDFRHVSQLVGREGQVLQPRGVAQPLREITQLEKQGTFNLEPNQATLAIARALP